MIALQKPTYYLWRTDYTSSEDFEADKENAQKVTDGGADNISLGSGLYIVKLQTTNGEVTRKVVVE